MDEQNLRQRSHAKFTNQSSERIQEIDTDESEIEEVEAVEHQDEEEDSPRFGVSLLDVIRVVLGLLLLNSLLSYFITSDSIFWNRRPRWTRWPVVKTFMTGPITLTDAELRAYDGTNPNYPIYLAINGTIFDVSASPENYGPGGSYHFFAGHDATRAYVTGCFDTDITWDLRGVEEMYMPVGDAVDEESLSAGQKKVRREKEVREAKKKVEGGVRHWENFFKEGKGGLYFPVGRVKRDKSWKDEMPVRKVCEKALSVRPKRNKGKS